MSQAPKPVSLQAVRVTRAFDDALGRLTPAIQQTVAQAVGQGHDATDAILAPLGETLMWLFSLDDLLLDHFGLGQYRQKQTADPDGVVVLGLKLVRNAVVHGAQLVSIAKAHPGSVLGRASLPMRIGAAPNCEWVSRGRLPKPPRHVRTPKDQALRETIYDSEIMGKPVALPIRRAISFLRREAGT